MCLAFKGLSQLLSRNMAGSRARRVLRSNMLSIMTVAGVVVGIICGVLIRGSVKEGEDMYIPSDDLVKGIR